jgi:hypothetical protein
MYFQSLFCYEFCRYPHPVLCELSQASTLSES